jgi:hypothetical protein
MLYGYNVASVVGGAIGSHGDNEVKLPKAAANEQLNSVDSVVL